MKSLAVERTIIQLFIEKLKEIEPLNLPSNQYLIWGSGPLAIRGIRESHDFDLVVTKKLWARLSEKYPSTTEKLIRIGGIEIWNDCLNLTSRIDEMVSHPDVIEGFPFMTLLDTIEWKRFMNREKDLKEPLAKLQRVEKTMILSHFFGR